MVVVDYPLGTLGQDTFTKEVQVIDAVTKEPVPGVDIKVLSTRDITSGVTDKEGKAVFTLKLPKYSQVQYFVFGSADHREARKSDMLLEPTDAVTVKILPTAALATTGDTNTLLIVAIAMGVVAAGVGIYMLAK